MDVSTLVVACGSQAVLFRTRAKGSGLKRFEGEERVGASHKEG